MKKIIICDMDNTLCESCRQISDEMAGAITGLIRKGYEFAVITGGTPQHIDYQVCSKLTVPVHILGNSGTKYYKYDGKKMTKVYEMEFSKKEKQRIIKAFNELIEKYNIISQTTKADQLQDRGSQITLSAIGRNAPHEAKEKYDSDKKKRIEWKKFLEPKLPEFTITVGGTTSLDVTKKGFDKGFGVKKFAEANGFKLEDILFIGDAIFPGGNDYTVVGVVDYINVKTVEEALEKLKELIK